MRKNPCRMSTSPVVLVLLVSFALLPPRPSFGFQAVDYPNSDRIFRSTIDDLRAIREHLLLVDPADRPHLRFLTLSHLANNSRFNQQDLDLLRAAAAKMLNSLSWRTEIHRPQAVTATQGCVLAIDLRQWNWSDGKQWLQIVNHYPYGLKFNHVKDAELKQLANDVEQLSGAEIPMVRADWFVYAASRPPLYHELLQIPDNLTELAGALGVELDVSVDKSTAVRSGFSKSRVSSQNRMVERHESRFGALWLAYDFLPRRGRGDLIRYPLGPKSANNPFHHYAFEADLIQALFHLPNGIQAYFLADSEGNRIDQFAPIEIVHDPSAIAGTAAIINGVSCIHCHHEGVIDGFRDEIRNSGAQSGDVLQVIERLHVPHDQLTQLIERDRKQFLTALRNSIAPSRTTHSTSSSDSKFSSITDAREPIGWTTKIYLEDLGPQEVAFELGLDSIHKIESQILSDRELKRLGLGIFLHEPAGVIKRARWEAIEGTSFFQDVAVELGLGTPLLPGSTRIFSRPVTHKNP